MVLPPAEKPYDDGELVVGPFLSAFIKLLPPNSFEEHSHAHGQVTLLLGGAGEINWRNKLGRRRSQTFDGDSVWLAPPHGRHSLRIIRPTLVAAYYLGPGLMAEAGGQRWRYPSVDPLSHYLHRDGLIAELVRKIRGFFRRRPGDHQLQNTGGLFVHHVLGVHLGPRQQELVGPQGLTDAIEKHLRGFIAARFAESISRAALAKEAGGQSPWHFGRMFAVTFGAPPGRYLRDYRLARAKERLEEESGMTITDIALACGFSGPNPFTAHFKRRYEVTPSMFLQRLRRTRAKIKG